MRSLHTTTKSRPCLLKLEKAQAQQPRSSAAKKLQKKKAQEFPYIKYSIVILTYHLSNYYCASWHHKVHIQGRRSDDGGGRDSITCHWTEVPWADCGLRNGTCASWPALSCLSLITTQRRHHSRQSLKVWDATVALLNILHELRITDWPHLFAALWKDTDIGA